MNPSTAHCFKTPPSQHPALDSHPALRCRTRRTFWRWHQAPGWNSWHDSLSCWSPVSLDPPRITEVHCTWQGGGITLRPGSSSAGCEEVFENTRLSFHHHLDLRRFTHHNSGSSWYWCCNLVCLSQQIPRPILPFFTEMPQKPLTDFQFNAQSLTINE